MSNRMWIQIPAVASESASTRTKYSIDSSALIIYRGDSAYVRYADTALSEPVARYGDVRILDEHEARSSKRACPFLHQRVTKRSVECSVSAMPSLHSQSA
jgi:hypothetical protein